MSLISRVQKETLVYWPLTEFERTGEPIWGAPEEMTCRWDSCSRQVIAANDSAIFPKHEIITEKLLVVGGLVRRGTLADTAYWENPKDNQDAFEIIKVCETPTLNYGDRLYEAYA